MNATGRSESRSKSPLDDRPTSKDHVNQSSITCFPIIPAAFNNVPKILYESIAVLVSEVDSLKKMRNNDFNVNDNGFKEMRKLITLFESQLSGDIGNAKWATEVVKKELKNKIDNIRADVSDRFSSLGSKISDVEMKLEMIN